MLEIGSDQYQSLRSALRSARRNKNAVLSLLSTQTDRGISFVEAAYTELRRSLVQGRLVEAEEIGEMIAAVLEAQEGGADDELAENRIHRESLRWLVDGIGAILGQDTLTGITFLENLTGAVYCNESLQWVAWLWVGRAAADAGDMNTAQIAAREACELGERLDAQAAATSLATLGEIKILRGEHDKALQHLSAAGQTFEEIGDRRGLASTWLARARVHAAAGEWQLAHGAAAWAAEIDADWTEPVVFLSRHAIIAGELEEAARVLAPFVERDPRPAEIDRELRVLDLIRRGAVDITVYRRFYELQEQMPGEAVVEELKQIVAAHPEYHHVRELLAWNLAKMARDEEAQIEFEYLSSQSMDAYLQTSVLLGLGCLANRRNLHRQPGARVRAAATAKTTGELGRVQEPAPAPTVRSVPAAEPPPPEVKSQHHTAMLGSTQEPEAASLEAPKAVFTGTLQLFAVPDLLEFLRSSRRTGTLIITSEQGIGAVHMSGGNLTGAASPECPNLGELLLEEKVIDDEQLKAAAESQQQQSPDHLLGAILVESGVSREAVCKALTNQIHRAILEMVEWTQGHFAFEPDKGATASDGEIVVELDTQSVLLEVLRQFDEANR